MNINVQYLKNWSHLQIVLKLVGKNSSGLYTTVLFHGIIILEELYIPTYPRSLHLVYGAKWLSDYKSKGYSRETGALYRVMK